MFEKTLTDIVKGIRASKRDTALYISQCIAEIKTEINSSDMYVKANALQKLTFLQMMGYGMSWASFATIEVMSSPRFAHKRIGYLAASQGFTQDTDVILLTTNLLKKELRGAIGGSMNGVYEAGLAINCVSNIVTEELAQDLLPELTNLTSHPQPYLRKKAILCLYKVFVKYPQGLRLTFAQIQQCLGDSNPAVVSCAVNVITELSDKNPKNYLHLAPAFFDLLTNSSNNWMLIKVVKLLGSLVPEEPRLARKLLEPLADIVRNTPAKSLLYEAVHAITLCLPYCRKSDGSMPASVPDIVALCARTLRDFVEEKDQNLKYLGLVGFGSLMQSHPKVLSAPDYRPLILTCLSDEDVTIRSRALGLLPGMASRKNLMELVTQLLQHVELASGSYKLELVARIVEMCSGEKYALLQDFSWYLDTLLKLGHMRGLDAHADLLRQQVTDVALRVLPVRAYAVKRSIETLLEGEQGRMITSDNLDGDNGRGKHIMPEILPATAWIVGEYSDLIPEAISVDQDAVYVYNDDSEGPYHSVIQSITAPANSVKRPPSTQRVFVQASMKVFAAAAANRQVSDPELEACANTLSHNLPVFMQSTDVEVQERAFTLYGLLQSLGLQTFAPGEGTPGLQNIDSDDDVSSSPGVGNLLGEVSGNTGSDVKGENKSGNLSGNLASKCRSSTVLLNFILKPSPMKPTGAKLQRKKHQSPIGVEIDLSAPVDLSLFSALIDEENQERASVKPSMESVTFTQQRPLRVQEKNYTLDSVSSQDYGPAGGIQMISTEGNIVGSESSSFDHSRGFARPPTASDPFYLNSGPAMLDAVDESNPAASRLRTIQLGDGDSDDHEGEGNKKKKKKKSKKHKETQHVPFDNGGGLNQGGFGQVFYDSDDDDDDYAQKSRGHRTGRKSGPGKEFQGLSKVDLTMPLREDEVMPERKHRVVPDRPTEAPQENTTESKPKKKKKDKKKESKRNKKEANMDSGVQAQDTVGDLLDLGGDFTTPSVAVPPDYSNTMSAYGGTMLQGQSSAVNNAFDDLLNMSQPTPQLPGFSMLDPASPPPSGIESNTASAQPSNASSSSKRPWLRANIKITNSTGPPVVDWSKVQLSVRIYRSSGGGPAASFAARVDNYMEMSALNDLVLKLNDHGDVKIGSVPSGSSVESSKTGPFTYPMPDMPLEIKGSLVSGECIVPVKITMPVCIHVSPIEGLSLEAVAQQLSSQQWSSHSVKLDLARATTGHDKLKGLLSGFLRMVEVEPEATGPAQGTFAGQTASGAQVRVLVKVKSATLKVDVKSTNPSLGKAITSDLKKLIL